MADASTHPRSSTPPPEVSVRAEPRNLQRLGYRRIVQLLVYLIIVPTVLSLAVGIAMLFLEAQINLLFGLLTVSFVTITMTGIVLVLVFVRREANLSELQADFVSKVSHELRTPLTAIRLFAETLERSPDPDTAGKCRAMIIEETGRLSAIIERLLDWGRMEAGGKIYQLQSARVVDICAEAANAFRVRHFGDQVVFKTEIDDNLPNVRADRAAMVDALNNLLSNARKYGGTPPEITLRATTTPKNEVRIDVTDNGDGIPRGEQSRIFQKFYRIDDRLARTREGSGLGLAIVKHVAQAHGARVVVDSAKGKGSTFSIVLPPERATRGTAR